MNDLAQQNQQLAGAGIRQRGFLESPNGITYGAGEKNQARVRGNRGADTGTGAMKEIPLAGGGVALVDDADFSMLVQHAWRALAHPKRHTSYAVARVGGKHVIMHRMILQAPRAVEVDHVDGNGLNNQRKNLRLATDEENARNRRPPRRWVNKHVRYKGVYVRGEQFGARIVVEGRFIKLGLYETQEAAALAYNDAARHYFGDFARCNLVDEALREPRALRSNVTGLKGVTKSGRRFMAQLAIGRRHIYLGTFDTAAEAARAYDYCARCAWGEKAILNFPDNLG